MQIYDLHAGSMYAATVALPVVLPAAGAAGRGTPPLETLVTVCANFDGRRWFASCAVVTLLVAPAGTCKRPASLSIDASTPVAPERAVILRSPCMQVASAKQS